MQLLLRVFISLILLQGVCQAHEINPDDTEMVSNKAYEEYFKDYTQRLYENYKPEKHFLRGWSQGDEFMYIIRRDGTVENLDNFFRSNRFARYGKKVILETKPAPFPDEIKDDIIFVDTWMIYYKDDEQSFRLHGRSKYDYSRYWKRFYDIDSINIVIIELEKDCRIKKRSK